MAAKRNRTSSVTVDDRTTTESRIPHCITRVPITDLNPHLTCALCSGYFVDATTVVECLHSFCRACLLSYVETSDTCPICDTQINENQLHKSIRSDHTLQDLVYKLIPGLYRTELQRRKEFCLENFKNVSAEPCTSSAPSTDKLFEIFDKRLVDLASSVCAPDEIVSFSLEFYHRPQPQPVKRGRRQSKKRDSTAIKSPSDCTPALKDLSYKRYFRCPAAVKMTHLKKLLSLKLDLSSYHQVDIWHLSTGDSIGDELLSDDWSLRDVAFIYSWNRKAPLRLHFNVWKYEIEEEPMPKLVREEEQTESENPSPACSTNDCSASSNTIVDVLRRRSDSGLLAIAAATTTAAAAAAAAAATAAAIDSKPTTETGSSSSSSLVGEKPQPLIIGTLAENDATPEISPTSSSAAERGVSQPAKLRFKKSLISVVQQLATSNGTFFNSPVAATTTAAGEVPEDPNHVNGQFAGDLLLSRVVASTTNGDALISANKAKKFKRENGVETDSVSSCPKNLHTPLGIFRLPQPTSNPNTVAPSKITNKNKNSNSTTTAVGSTGKNNPQQQATSNALNSEPLLCT